MGTKYFIIVDSCYLLDIWLTIYAYESKMATDNIFFSIV